MQTKEYVEPVILAGSRGFRLAPAPAAAEFFVGAAYGAANVALPLSVQCSGRRANAAPTRPLDTDVTSLHVPSALQDCATGQRHIMNTTVDLTDLL